MGFDPQLKLGANDVWNAAENSQRYDLVFSGCSKIEWIVGDVARDRDNVADIIGIDFSKNSKHVVVTTDVCELILDFESYEAVKC